MYPKFKTSQLMHWFAIQFACKNVKTSPLSTQFVTDGAELWNGSKSEIKVSRCSN